MNWLIFISDILFAVVAAILGILGLSTLKAIKHLGIGKSFWIPVSVSGALFLIGAIFRVLQGVVVELGLPLTINAEGFVHISWLLALCTLMFSIYNYSGKVRTIREASIANESEELTVRNEMVTRVPISDAHNESAIRDEQKSELLQRIERLKRQAKD